MRIAVIAYDRISPFMLSTPLAVFAEPFLRSEYRVDVCSSALRLSASGGLTIEANLSLEATHDADIVILPGWRDADEPVSADIVAALLAAHAHGAIVVGLCLGAFGLAEAGLLDGRRATTHWSRTQTLTARYPSVTVDAGALFVDEGQVITSAGIASGVDCCLHLVARMSGTGEANRVARHLVVAPQRAGTQPQLIESPTLGSSANRRATQLLEEVRADPMLAPSLDALAEKAGMSRRSLTRHIRARTGGNLGTWLKHARLARAQEILAAGARGFDDVAIRSGFPNAHALRAAFRSELHLTPTQWLARQRLG
ncbi:GlxA family transcriptional regulator [Aureimonas sp. AU40]|uniref:GlxA family transcriptional regulator n=1 Tax=Aureimonas sp. AU40 TaxID=1637747 RepID=UPI00078516A4|nr:DJ-1/PfpI family protein [Aureimonas sp. AU40]